MDNGNVRMCSFGNFDSTLGIGKDVLAIISGTQCPHPTIEDLHHMCACLDLCLEILPDKGTQFLHETMPCLVLGKHKRFHFDMIATTPTFDSIRSQREGRTTE